MSTGMPELGSKISLISKADIRYEGRLFTVDPQECTIALASVRSFGTEDRETQYPVAPQNQVYDYILFRGSDIKDIRVVNNVAAALPNDPAIMQLGQHQYQPPAFSYPQMGPPMGPQMPYNSHPYPLGPPVGMRPLASKPQPSELLSNVLAAPLGPQPVGSPPADQAPIPPRNNDFISGGSRSTTPASLLSRKSPTIDASVQVSSAPAITASTAATTVNKEEKKPMVRPIQPPGHHRPRDNHQEQQKQNQQRNMHQQQQRSTHMQNQHLQQQQNMNRGGSGGNNWPNRGNMRQRGRGRMPQGMFRQPQGIPSNASGAGGKPKSTLKFENDYDFEQANTEFEELRSKLAKIKLSEIELKTTLVNATPSTTVPAVAEVNGDLEKKDDSGNETGAGEGEHDEEAEVYYDKSKSFFDNISCEAVERSKGRSQRTDWRTERKLNSETFGVSSTRRGGYRGRGGYYNRGMYRGGYRGGLYRGQIQSQPQRNTRQGQGQNQTVPNQPLPVAAAAGK